MIADVEKMYLQIKLAQKDQDVHRYLWRDLITDEVANVNRMRRLTFGVNSCPFLAIATVHVHANKYAETFPNAVREILHNIPSFTDSLNQERSSPTASSTPVFGVIEYAIQRCYGCPFSDKKKRQGVKAFSRAVHILTVKEKDHYQKFMTVDFESGNRDGLQELWRRGLEWNDPLDSDIKSERSSWKSELLQIKEVAIPRWFGTNVTSESIVELHSFGHASPKAYGAAVYIRVIYKLGQSSSQLVMSKSRVAPIKEVSPPRLELLAAWSMIDCCRYFANQMHRVVCWT
ncbi:hypothetical protein ACROYT_G004931 [Oculina patagonica]